LFKPTTQTEATLRINKENAKEVCLLFSHSRFRVFLELNIEHENITQGAPVLDLFWLKKNKTR